MTRKEYMRTWRQTPRAKESNRRKSARYRAANPEKVREIDRRRYRKRKQYVLESNERRRALIRGICGFHSREEWESLCQRCEGVCTYCGNQCENYTKDHFVPLALGGSNNIENIVPACRSCNSSKGKISPEQFAVWIAKRRLGITL